MLDWARCEMRPIFLSTYGLPYAKYLNISKLSLEKCIIFFNYFL